MPISRYYITAKRLGLVLMLYFLCRVLFYTWNYNQFDDAAFGSIILAFLHGLRFDLSMIFSSNLLFILLSLIPFDFVDSRKFQVVLKFIFLLINIPLLIMNIADIVYFKFTLKRTGYEVIGIMEDATNQSIQFFFNFWYIPLSVVIFIFYIIKFYPNNHSKLEKKWSKFISSIVLVIVIVLSVVVIRGGLQYKPLKPDHAFVLKPNVLGNLVLNTPYNFFSTMAFPSVEKVVYFKTEKEVSSIIKNGKTYKYKSTGKYNVVLLIMESFSREYMGITGGKSYTPFLDSLARKGVFLNKHFANGRKSVEAVPALFASIPSLMDEPYITGVYQSNELHGIAEVLSKDNYHTAFFHGGRNGTMGFDKFCLNAGFNSYYGLDEYPNKEKDYDGHWGVFDEPYLNYFNAKLSGFKQPFMASFFSLSSHQPYTIPEKYKGRFPKGELEIHESIGYADHALRMFFNEASKQSWYNNTLFVITADHTQYLTSQEYLNILGVYRVPLLFYHPGKKIEMDTTQVSHHADILPTILDYVGVENKYPLYFGNSLLDSIENKALLYADKRYLLITKDYFYEFDGANGDLYSYSDPHKLSSIKNLPDKKVIFDKKLKAFIQYHNNGLNYNNWYKY